MKKCDVNERLDGAKTINVIHTELLKGDGEKIPYHRVQRFYLLDGTFIGEISPYNSSILLKGIIK